MAHGMTDKQVTTLPAGGGGSSVESIGDLDDVQDPTGTDDTVLTYTSDTTDGIFDWLGKLKGTTTWAHPETSRSLVVTSQKSTYSSFSADRAIDQHMTNQQHTTNATVGEWVKFDFGVGITVTVTKFAIEGHNYSTNLPRNFYWEGSNDDSAWDELYDSGATGPAQNSWFSASITTTGAYRYYRMFMYGDNNSGGKYLINDEIEFWGTYHDVAPDAPDDGDVLTYVSADSEWQPVVPSGGGTVTTKGDLEGFSTVAARIPVGTNDQVLTADSAEALGVKWAAASGGGGGGGGTGEGAEIRFTGNQALTTGTWTFLSWDAEEYDDNGYWEGVTNPTRITFAAAGRYLVSPNIKWEKHTTGYRYMRAVRNGVGTSEIAAHSLYPTAGFANDRDSWAFIVDAAANDYIEIEAYHNRGANLNIEGQGAIGDDLFTTRCFIAKMDTTNGGSTVTQDFTTLTNTATGTSNTWEQWGTEELRFTEFDGVEVTVKADLVGNIKNFSGTGNGRKVRIQISLDDGSTWSDGNSAEGKAAGAGADSTTRWPGVATFAVTGTVTTAVQVRAQLYEANATVSTFENAGMSATVATVDIASGSGWEAWIAVSGGIGFSNSWVDYGGGTYQPAEYRKHADGMVQVRGFIKTGTLDAVCLTLPTGYRPQYQSFFAAACNGGPSMIEIQTGGGIYMTTNMSATWSDIGMTFDSTGGT